MLATGAALLTSIATNAVAETSVAISPVPPKQDAFERLANSPNFGAGARNRVPDRLGPIAVVDLRRIVLQRDDETDWIRTYITPLAEQYTNIGNVPIGVYLLALCAPDFRRSEGLTYRRRIADTLGKIDSSLIPTGDRPRQRQILQASDEMLERIATGADIPRDELDAFARRLSPLHRANADAAAADLGISLDAATTEMRRVLKPGEWQQLQVAIIDSEIPFAAQLQYLHFKQLLGPTEASRLYFVREEITIGAGMAFAVRRSMQESVSRAFFGDQTSGRVP